MIWLHAGKTPKEFYTVFFSDLVLKAQVFQSINDSSKNWASASWVFVQGGRQLWPPPPCVKSAKIQTSETDYLRAICNHSNWGGKNSFPLINSYILSGAVDTFLWVGSHQVSSPGRVTWSLTYPKNRKNATDLPQLQFLNLEGTFSFKVFRTSGDKAPLSPRFWTTCMLFYYPRVDHFFFCNIVTRNMVRLVSFNMEPYQGSWRHQLHLLSQLGEIYEIISQLCIPQVRLQFLPF